MKILGAQPQINKEKCLSWTVERPPCENACPAHLNVEGYINAIRKRKFNQAVEIIRESLPLPATLGRVCHRPCESACKMGKVSEPIAIMELKRFAADFVLMHSKRPDPIKKSKKEKVSIIGSGPAGLAAGYDLIKKGFGVTIYEASSIAGGMLTTAIPEVILPRDIVETEIDYIRALGVDIQTGVSIGDKLSLDNLWEQGCNAILLATGAQKSVPLKIPGGDLKGVYYALPLLQKVSMGERVSFKGRVVVIGGGGVAIDAARSVMRLGADEVFMTCLESKANIPAFAWEIDAAKDEGVAIHASLAPQKISTRIGGKSGRPLAIEFRRVTSTRLDAEGQISWELMEGGDSEVTIEANSVVVAIGQTGDTSCINGTDVKTSRKGTIVIDPDTLSTNVRGVFAAGDAVTGPKTVIEAVAKGKKAATIIDRYLNGKELKEIHTPNLPVLKDDILPQGMRFSARQPGVVVPRHLRLSGFSEVNLGFTEEQAVREANRCLRCKTCNRCIELYGCVAIAWSQNQELEKINPQIDADLCIGCGVCPQLCPYNSIELL